MSENNKNKIRTEIIIEANASKVWNVLRNLSEWSEWNPFMTEASGNIEAGESLRLCFSSKNKKMVITPRVQKVEKEKSFSWKGSAMAGAFVGEHYFILEKEDENITKLIHGENFNGWLVWLILPLLKADTLKGFMEMNRALKNRVESKGNSKS